MTVPIEGITFDDISTLIGAEEGPRIEFKQALATSDGRPDRWMNDQSRIGAVARDDIAKEVVAFANAYGGLLIVGIEETDDNPKRAKAIAEPLIPKITDCANQLERALRSIIEPPLPMLEVRGVVSTGDNGVLVVRVGASPSAPHGYGRPSLGYVRRGAASEPLTMHDLQSIFFERRTRLERVQSRRAQIHTANKEVYAACDQGELRIPRDTQPFLPTMHGIYFSCSAVPSDDFAIDNFPDNFLNIPHQLTPRPMILQHGDLIALPQSVHDWRRRYRAMQYAAISGESRYWQAIIEADGSMSFVSIFNFATPPVIYLHEYSATILQIMVLCEWMRRWAARPDVEYVVDAAFICRSGRPRIHMVEAGYTGASEQVPWRSAQAGPYSIGKRETFPRTFDSIERELWDLCGVHRQQQVQLKMNFEAIFKSTGL
jgi:hypothetical protein